MPVDKLTQLQNFLAKYQEAAARTDQNPVGGTDGLAFPLLGLFGEVGTLLSALKKKQRDKDSYAGYSEAVLEEFGDVLWYFSNIASRSSLRLSEIAGRAFNDLPRADGLERNHLRRPHSPEFEAALIALAGQAGLLLNEFSGRRIAENPDLLAAHLGNIFFALVRAAAIAD